MSRTSFKNVLLETTRKTSVNRAFKVSHKKMSSGVMSENLRGQVTGSFLPTQRIG